MESNTKDFQSNIDNYRWFYQAYEVGLFLDTLSRQHPLYQSLKFNLTDWDYQLDRGMVEGQLKKLYWKPFEEYQWNYYGLILCGSFSVLFSSWFEIMELYPNHFKTTITSKIWKESYEHYYQVFRFLRNFWIHNSNPEFKIQESHFSIDKKRILKGKYAQLFPNWVVNFKYPKTQIPDFTFQWDIDLKIDFNSLEEWQDIRDICSFDEMKQLLRLFYNFCYLWDTNNVN